jgi:hypothetical protein
VTDRTQTVLESSRLPRIRTLAALASLLPHAAAHACTVCDSRNGQQLRAGLFNGDFLHTLLLVAAPVPVFAAVLLLVHFGMPDLSLAESQADLELLSEPELTA